MNAFERTCLFKFDPGGFEESAEEIEVTHAQDQLRGTTSAVTIENLRKCFIAEPHVSADFICHAAEEIALFSQGGYRVPRP